MTERLTISFAPAEGALVRMLGLVERRGYAVHGLTMSEEEGSGLAILDVKPRDAGRRVNVIAQQLLRLIDVHSVTLAARDEGSSQ